MAKRKTPLRKCVVTGELRPKKELVRVVKTKENEVFLDETGKKNGRGAYISLDEAVVEQARENNVLSSALKTNITPEFYDELVEHVKYWIARMEIMRQNEE